MNSRPKFPTSPIISPTNKVMKAEKVQTRVLKLAQRWTGKLSNVRTVEDYQYVLETYVKDHIDPEHRPVQEICARKEFTIGGPIRERETVRWSIWNKARNHRDKACHKTNDDRGFHD